MWNILGTKFEKINFEHFLELPLRAAQQNCSCCNVCNTYFFIFRSLANSLALFTNERLRRNLENVDASENTEISLSAEPSQRASEKFEVTKIENLERWVHECFDPLTKEERLESGEVWRKCNCKKIFSNFQCFVQTFN